MLTCGNGTPAVPALYACLNVVVAQAPTSVLPAPENNGLLQPNF